MYFAWNEDYSVNIEAIDNQHKKLFEIGRQVSGLIFSNDASVSDEDIIEIFNKLKNYTEFHFKFEENLLKEYGFAHYKTHKHEHDKLTDALRKLESKWSGDLQKSMLIELLDLVFEWISHHILKRDKKYKDFFDEIRHFNRSKSQGGFLK